jgi:hypothetical protein
VPDGVVDRVGASAGGRGRGASGLVLRDPGEKRGDRERRNFIIGLGFVVMGHNPWLGSAYLLLFPLIYLPTVLEEERFLRAKFGTAYERYLDRVPRFFPRWLPGTEAVGRFRWGLVIFHREHRTWYGLGAAVAAVVARAALAA